MRVRTGCVHPITIGTYIALARLADNVNTGLTLLQINDGKVPIDRFHTMPLFPPDVLATCQTFVKCSMKNDSGKICRFLDPTLIGTRLNASRSYCTSCAGEYPVWSTLVGEATTERTPLELSWVCSVTVRLLEYEFSQLISPPTQPL
jgi:hypothetical protein